MRHRDGGGGGWTVKLPDGDRGPARARLEVGFEGGASRMPSGVLDLLQAYVRTSPLQGVARLRTHRTGVELRNGDDRTVAEVVDDEVSVLHGSRVTARFREVEVEVGEAAVRGLLDVIRAALVHSVARILAHDPGVRVGDDPSDVHQLRVGIRRLRSDLRTFRPVLDEEWVRPLRDELEWGGGPARRSA